MTVGDWNRYAMFTLAHLSDPHLAPLPEPRWVDLIGKRVTGYINWQRKRRFIHETAVLDAIIADMKAQAPDHIAVTGDIVNIALEEEFVRGREWLQTPGLAATTSASCPAITTSMSRRRRLRAARSWARYMTDDDGAGGFPYRAPARPARADRPVQRRADRAVHGDRPARHAADRGAGGRCSTKLKDEGPVPRHPDPSSAGDPSREAQAAARCAGACRDDLRGTAPSWCCTATTTCTCSTGCTGPAGTRVPAVGVPSASAAPGTRQDAAGLQSLPHRRRDAARGAARWCRAASVKPDGTIVESGADDADGRRRG